MLKKKKLKRELGRLIVATDYGDGRDMTAKCYFRYINGVFCIFKIKLIEVKNE
jgi:hypothetical protein